MNTSNLNKKIIIFIIGIFIFIFLTFSMIIFFNPYPLKFKDEIIENANKFNIQAELIASVINTESGFNTEAKSSSGAMGLMQILPTTAEWLCVKLNKTYNNNTLFSAKDNIEIGTFYLQYLFEKFHNINNVLAAYNAGEGNVILWLINDNYTSNGILTSTPFPETNAYIEKVIKGLEPYKNKLNINNN